MYSSGEAVGVVCCAATGPQKPRHTANKVTRQLFMLFSQVTCKASESSDHGLSQRLRKPGTFVGPGSPFGGVAEQCTLTLGEQLAEELQVDLGGAGVLTAQLGKFGGQLLETIMEAVILAFEEHRDLTKHVSIVDLFDTEHTRTTSRACSRAK